MQVCNRDSSSPISYLACALPHGPMALVRQTYLLQTQLDSCDDLQSPHIRKLRIESQTHFTKCTNSQNVKSFGMARKRNELKASEASPVAKKLRVFRERHGLTMEEMGGAIGGKATTYIHYETRFKRPYLPLEKVEQWAALCRRKGIDPSELYEMAGATPPTTKSVTKKLLEHAWRYHREAMESDAPRSPDEESNYFRRLQDDLAKTDPSAWSVDMALKLRSDMFPQSPKSLKN